MSYNDMVRWALTKWAGLVDHYYQLEGETGKKHRSAYMVYAAIDGYVPEEALIRLKNIRDDETFRSVGNVGIIDEGVEDVKKLMNYHEKFRVYKKKRTQTTPKPKKTAPPRKKKSSTRKTKTHKVVKR